MALTAIAMVLDLRTRKLPNWLTVPAFVLALVFHGCTGGLPGLGSALGGFAIGFGILLLLWLIGGGGGGDVKLMGAIGAWIGPVPTLIVFFCTALIAVAAVVVIFFWKILVGTGLRRAYDSLRAKNVAKNAEKKHARPIPYAVPVAVAVWGLMILKLIAASNH